jgi:hypothetical protein
MLVFGTIFQIGEIKYQDELKTQTKKIAISSISNSIKRLAIYSWDIRLEIEQEVKNFDNLLIEHVEFITELHFFTNRYMRYLDLKSLHLIESYIQVSRSLISDLRKSQKVNTRDGILRRSGIN